jgi:exopolysaccharide biosynthesis protein
MKRFFSRRWPLLYGAALAAATVFILLDTFVIPHVYASVGSASSSAQSTPAQTSSGSSGSSGGSSSSAAATATTYSSDGISITVTTYREYDTDIYVADVTLSDASQLRTAFAQSTYGRNITETTSGIASDAGAVLAINGDYYSARSGYVIRNGELYRSTSAGSSQEDLVVWSDGTFEIVSEGDYTAQELLDKGAQQVLSFGPGLVENGQISVSENDEVSRAKTSNPRTAIGMIDALHYVFVVADGRTGESSGLSLYELAEFMQGLGADTAYNLDGGGSSTMVFNGQVINNPTTNGTTISERKVSDIVCIV